MKNEKLKKYTKKEEISSILNTFGRFFRSGETEDFEHLSDYDPIEELISERKVVEEIKTMITDYKMETSLIEIYKARDTEVLFFYYNPHNAWVVGKDFQINELERIVDEEENEK